MACSKWRAMLVMKSKRHLSFAVQMVAQKQAGHAMSAMRYWALANSSFAWCCKLPVDYRELFAKHWFVKLQEISQQRSSHLTCLLEGCWQCFLNFYQRSHFGEKFSHLCILALLARSFAWKSMPVEANRWSSKETEQTHWSASWTGNYPVEKPHFLKLGRLPINISNRSLYLNSSKHVKTATLGASKRESWSSSLEKIGSNCSFSVFRGISSRPNDSNLGHDSDLRYI